MVAIGGMAVSYKQGAPVGISDFLEVLISERERARDIQRERERENQRESESGRETDDYPERIGDCR